MKTVIKNKLICVTFTKTEQAVLDKAIEKCDDIGMMSPMDPNLKADATEAAARMRAVLLVCAPPEKAVIAATEQPSSAPHE